MLTVFIHVELVLLFMLIVSIPQFQYFAKKKKVLTL